jgi:flagellar hook-associated protein 3 FlgL
MRSLSLGEDERFINLDDRLTNLDTGIETILSAQAQVGSRTNRLERTQTQNEGIIQNLTELKSSNDDVDMARIITELKTLENVLNASLGVGAQLLPPSLFDYLR